MGIKKNDNDADDDEGNVCSEVGMDEEQPLSARYMPWKSKWVKFGNDPQKCEGTYRWEEV